MRALTSNLHPRTCNDRYGESRIQPFVLLNRGADVVDPELTRTGEQLPQVVVRLGRVHTVPVLTQPQFNGLFSLCYNIGTGGFKGSTVLKLVNQNIWDERLLNAFLLWDKAGGVVNNGLLARRRKEYAICTLGLAA